MTTTDEEKKEPRKKKRSLLGRLVWLLVVLAAVLGVAALTTMEDGRHFAALRRWLVYGEGSATKDAYAYAPNPANRYGLLGDGLLVVSPNTVQLHRDDGSMIYDLPLQVSDPQLSVGNRLAAVCDVGGSALYVLDGTGVQRTLSKSGELCYYGARMNGGDYLTVTEQANGYKSSVSVYDSAGEALFTFDSYDSYVSDAVATDDGRSLVAVRLEPYGGVYASRVLVYDIATGQLRSSTPIRDGLVLDLAVTGDRILCLCDKRLTMLSLDGETLLDLAYGSLYLNDYALGGKDFCALLLGRYQAGNVGTLTTYGPDGGAIASMDLTEEVLDMAAAGNYLAVLYDESLAVYDRELNEKARLDGTDYASQIRLESNGAVLLISGSSAWSFLP